MNDQNTPLVHKCNDEVAHVRIDQLQQQRQEDRQELSRQMAGTNKGIEGIDDKLDQVLDTQAKHGTQIAVLSAKSNQSAKGWGAVPQWVRVLIYIVAAVVGGGGGLAALNIPSQSQAPAVQPAEAPAAQK